MGFSTSYLGRFDIEPPLNPAETEWLCAFAVPHRTPPHDDPYALPMNPGADLWADPQLGAPLRGGGRSFSHDEIGRCDWHPCPEGCCLVWEEIEKSNAAVQELSYLIEHFLRPGAAAAASGKSDFDEFTFDHVVSGTVAARRGDTRELYLLVAEDNVIDTVTLVAGDSPW